jgi:ABC-type phosphate/phosphonate transport system substrate-binding protein
MIANLMMYARPELAGAHTRFWGLIRSHLARVGINAPRDLSQAAEEFSVWKHPDLVLSQTCGMPYRIWLHDSVELVGTPDYGLSDCPAGYYRSAFVVRAEDTRNSLAAFQDATFAFNQTFSQSGYAAPYWHTRPVGFWIQTRTQTHGHVVSALAVAAGRADIAALDAVTWRNVQRYEGFATKLRVLEWTAPTPGLPLITAKGQNAEAIHSAVANAIADLDSIDAIDLGLQGIVRIPKDTYLAVLNPPTSAQS